MLITEGVKNLWMVWQLINKFNKGIHLKNLNSIYFEEFIKFWLMLTKQNL
jgi:hypothetical protein